MLFYFPDKLNEAKEKERCHVVCLVDQPYQMSCFLDEQEKQHYAVLPLNFLL